MLDKLFSYTIQSQRDNIVEAIVNINNLHVIFEGHFPGYPIVPGVCMVQIIGQIFGDVIGKKILLKKAKSIKFLSLFNPNEVKQVQASIQYKTEENGDMSVKASLFLGDKIFFKLNGIFGG